MSASPAGPPPQRDRLDPEGSRAVEVTGWRSVFGNARREEVEAVDAVVAEELEEVDPREWT